MNENDILAGQHAPDFTATDMDGNTIQFSNYVGKKTLLVFFRFASCPLCTVRFAQLVQNFPNYQEKGLNIIAVFESSPDYVRKYINDKRKVPFPIIADLEGDLYKLYNVKKSILGTAKGMFRIFKMLKGMFDPAHSMGIPDGSISRVPADFLVNPLMIVKESYYGKDIGDHIPFKHIDNFLANSI